MQLANKVALVTGAGQGIGRSIALLLSGQGAAIAVCDVNEEGINKVVQEIKDSGGQAAGFVVDVSNAKAVAECVDKVLDTMKKIDILVNNAGITRDALLVRMKDDDWDAVIKVNLTGTYNFIKVIGKHMMRQRSGKIINIASTVGLTGNVGQVNYAASKAGVIGITKTCARELAPRGVNVNAVAPGFIQTKMTEKLPEEAKQKYLVNIPLNRFGVPEEVAGAVQFLAGPYSDYITGQVISVCGGMVM